MTANEELIEFLRGYVTPNKQEKIAAVLEDRTRHLTLVLEDLYQPHNASACPVSYTHLTLPTTPYV